MKMQTVYKPPLFFKNGHLQTIYATLFRKFDTAFYKRERIHTDDNDFLDLDWAYTGSDKLAIVSHGLEGSSHRAYVVGMVKALNAGGWDGLAWNYRGCSGSVNRTLCLYHSGKTDDLDQVVRHVKQTGRYKKIVLIGFSIGGNISLVYLGKKGKMVDPVIKKAVVFSVPCDLKGSSEALAKSVNKIYMKRFLIMLHEKIKAKMEVFPGEINDTDYEKIKDFKGFDDRYTAPLHGFIDAEDYWGKCSSNQFVQDISVPTLIVNAKNDPFLSDGCYPIKETASNKHVVLEMPESGGHVGFIEFNSKNLYWSEKRTVAFLS